MYSQLILQEFKTLFCCAFLFKLSFGSSSLETEKNEEKTACLLCKIKQQQPPLCTQRRNSLQLTLERRM